MRALTRGVVLVSFFALAGWCGTAVAQGQPDGQLTVAFDASIAPVFLDPAETPGIGTPFVFLYAMHDALIKPLPGNDMAPCLAESWKESPDGLVYEFKLRPGLKFHNGDPFTADDVKFTFQRYKGAAAKLLHDRVKAVDVVDPLRVRFTLDRPWPDFLLFYATPATGAAWIVPKKYIEKVGEEGFRRQPVGLGPYRVVRQTPGVELVLEANEQLAQETVDQDDRHQGRARPHDAPGHAEDRRGGHRLPDGRRRGGDHQGGFEAAAGPGDSARRVVARLSRAVESQVALAGPPRPAGGYHGGGQEGPQRGRAIGLLTPDGLDRPERHGIRGPQGALSLRPDPRQAPPRRRRLPQRLRRGRGHAATAVRHHGRERGELSGRRRHQEPRPRHGAGDLHGGVADED